MLGKIQWKLSSCFSAWVRQIKYPEVRKSQFQPTPSSAHCQIPSSGYVCFSVLHITVATHMPLFFSFISVFTLSLCLLSLLLTSSSDCFWPPIWDVSRGGGRGGGEGDTRESWGNRHLTKWEILSLEYWKMKHCPAASLDHCFLISWLLYFMICQIISHNNCGHDTYLLLIISYGGEMSNLFLHNVLS